MKFRHLGRVRVIMKIKTKSGVVLGRQEGRLYCFRGIPYAKAERFQPPSPFEWEGVLDATLFGKKSIQAYGEPSAWLSQSQRSEFDEQCLNLNIYTPNLNGALPVVVYIHGGAFQFGSGEPRDGHRMIREHNFIYVSINYRLGVLGYLYLGRLLGPNYQATGNLGTMDQLAAIRWVYENIYAFGGDPQRITVIGESAGAKSIAALLMCPDMQQYCKQVCLGSGAYQCIRNEETAHTIAKEFMEKGGIASPEELLTCSADRILEAQKKFCVGVGNTCLFGPVADGVMIPYHWQELMYSEHFWRGKAIVGSCRNEVVFYRRDCSNFLDIAPQIAAELFGRNAAIAQKDFAILERELHAQDDREMGEKLWVKILSDYMYRTYSHRFASILANNGSEVWFYSTEFGNGIHCLDQNLAFDATVDRHQIGEPSEFDMDALANQIYESYVQFFLYGNPNWDGIPEWPVFRMDNPMRMMWDAPLRVETVPEKDVLDSFPEYVYLR